MIKFRESIKAARRASAPIIAIESADQRATQDAVVKLLNGSAACVRQCVVEGVVPVNEAGNEALASIPEFAEEQPGTVNPIAALHLLRAIKGGAAIFMHNAHRHLQDGGFVQAVANVRDRFKTDRRTLFLLGPVFMLPPELQNDVIVLREPLPEEAEIRTICGQIHDAAGVQQPSFGDLGRAVDAVRGLSAFASEQVFAMSIGPKGMDVGACWDRKRSALNQTPGLKVSRPTIGFDQVRGLAQAREYTKWLFAGPQAPRVIIRLEEVEKMVAGAGFAGGVGDSSGTSQYQIGRLLTEMEERGWSGMITTGPAGSGKSLFATAVAGQNNRLLIDLDLGAMKGSLVGESEANINRALQVIHAIAGDGGAFFVATCNRMDSLPPELRRRFRSGVWFFDIPDAEERRAIWTLQLELNGLPKNSTLPVDTDWTGAEIRNCCAQAAALQLSPKDAAAFVIPIMQSQPQVVEKLRALAHGKFFSASHPGAYIAPKTMKTGSVKNDAGPRSIELPE